ncbi:DNA helicase UvrD [Candidatus Uhrbacteria bacterium]|nr:DNA helicase UvrD [Candidatus Uhrbacteria bacterium]
MRYIVDWHIHSKYSRACSKQLELPTIAQWCERKGINIVTTGDWTHPEWFKHIEESLVEDRQGVYHLLPELVEGCKTEFMLVQEVSQIYKKGDKTRRVHNLIFSPSIETCEKVNARLNKQGFNIKSDGRPILGIDSEELYKLLKEIDEKIIVVPAHAWTPWYAVFGSKSGFDSLEECFGEMSKYIYAIETGLSSDPEMNWQISALDKIVLVSNSDAHSPRNLGREANVFEFGKPPTFDDFVSVLKNQDTSRFKYTIEFYPQEGKYHFDGCAACKFSCDPAQSKKLGNRCPTCKRLLTLGVHNRVEELKDRDADSVLSRKIPFKSIVPLAEILAEVFGVKSVSSKKVEEEYMRLTNELADEFSILLDVPIATIRSQTNNENVALAIEKVRTGKVEVTPGYDGIYGTVKVFGKSGPKQQTQRSLL